MPTSVTMPALGESVTEGTVTRWLKQEGEQVEVDEPLLEVSTDKVDTEIPSPAAGVLTKILVSEDETVEVGAELAVIGGDGDGGGSGGDTGSADDADTAQTPDQQVEDASPEPQQEEQAAPQEEQAPAGGARTRRRRTAAPVAVAGGGGEGTPVTMPALGESVTEGTVTRWLKQEGEQVEVDEPLLEVSTDKVDTEIPSPAAGVLTKILVAEDETVEVGAQLAVIGGGGGAAAPAAAPAAGGPEAGGPEAGGPASRRPPSRRPRSRSAPSPGGAARPSRPAAAPAPQRQPERRLPPSGRRTSARRPRPCRSAGRRGSGLRRRRRAAATSLPWSAGWPARRASTSASVSGSGVGGRIRKQDVLAAAEQKSAPAPAAAAPRPAGRGRRRRRPRPTPRCAAGPRRCPACARSSPGAWWSPCRSAPS